MQCNQPLMMAVECRMKTFIPRVNSLVLAFKVLGRLTQIKPCDSACRVINVPSLPHSFHSAPVQSQQQDLCPCQGFFGEKVTVGAGAQVRATPPNNKKLHTILLFYALFDLCKKLRTKGGWKVLGGTFRPTSKSV